jgi:phenylacetate-CoA ligase
MGKFYSSILKRTILPIADKVMNTHIALSYSMIKQMRTWSPDKVQGWQNEKLSQLLEHAYNHTGYYNEIFNSAGLLPGDIRSIEDLRMLPSLSKETVRNKLTGLLPDNIRSYPFKKSATGGSTGDPLVYYLDNLSWSMSNANIIVNWENSGYNYGDKYIALGSKSLMINKKASLKHLVYYGLKNKIALNGVNMSEEICKDYISLIKKNHICYIYGYASAIYLLAKYVLLQNENLKIRTCFTTSEVLTSRFRETIKKAFQCEILDCYGANDGGVSAFAKEEGYFEVGYNCLVRVENPDENGNGPALLTDLFNYSMPLINYKLGDEIRVNTEKNKEYPFNGQIINGIQGRISDIIHLENGHTITGPGFTVLFKDLPVEHYFIIKTGVNKIECNILKLRGFTNTHEETIISTFKKHMGSDTLFQIKYITEIPLTKSGKRKYFDGDSFR